MGWAGTGKGQLRGSSIHKVAPLLGGQGGAGTLGAVSRLHMGCQVFLLALGSPGGDWHGPGRVGTSSVSKTGGVPQLLGEPLVPALLHPQRHSALTSGFSPYTHSATWREL